jgi:hypothetical protein
MRLGGMKKAGGSVKAGQVINSFFKTAEETDREQTRIQI